MSHSVALFILIFCGIILGYLFGSILFAVIIGKFILKKDPRDFYSKNAGATNSSRVFGFKIAFIILVFDVLKCFIPTVIMWMIAKFAINNSLHTDYYFSDYALLFLTPLSALIGHCYPIFFRFHGGKAASSIIGLMLCISPWITILTIIIWISIIKITKYVSLSSIISSIVIFILVFVPGINWMYMLDIKIDQLLLIDQFNLYSVLLVAGISLVASIMLIIRHKSNINKLIHHNERKIEKIKH